MRRFGQVIRLRSEAEEEYKKIHVKISPEVEEAIHEASIRNYSIFLKDGLLFAYYEYHGPENRMAQLSRISSESDWWTLTKPCSNPWKPANRVNGGRAWKKFFIRTNNCAK